ncbi:MAG: sigma-54 dependent transcriptional regulator [bacterium]
MSLVLIIDDVQAMREQYAYDLKRLGGHETITAASGAEGIQILETEPVDCCILDLEMPGVDGFEVLQTIRQRGIRVPVIVYTGTGNYERCVRAWKLGAFSFLDKEEPLERVVIEVENALRLERATTENRELRRRTGDDSPLIGASEAMTALKQQLQELAGINDSVLILGESGSGKELIARQLHELSERRQHPYLRRNCAALPSEMVESELFGHERGAFTGAVRTHKGAFEAASHGTLFLDEVGDLSIDVQAKLLSALENRVVTRLGSNQELTVDVRIVAATNRDLGAMVAAGEYRRDLLFRLQAFVVRVPPLRNRLDDVPLLVDFFLDQVCAEYGVKRKTIAPEALTLLQRYRWQENNVRELQIVVKRMVMRCKNDRIEPCHVTPDLPRSGAATADSPTDDLVNEPGSWKEKKLAAERLILLATLQRNDWQPSRVAAELDLFDHASVLKLMRKHGLKRIS